MEASPQFRTGFISRAEIYPNSNSQNLVVPIEALQDPNDQHAHVFVYSGGMASRRNIRTGELLERRIVVLEGLEPGEMVITEGAPYLKDGAAVELMNPDQAEKP
jgi:multidrug efflux pump subunit AcrA (membrane-fusion protein)